MESETCPGCRDPYRQRAHGCVGVPERRRWGSCQQMQEAGVAGKLGEGLLGNMHL